MYNYTISYKVLNIIQWIHRYDLENSHRLEQKLNSEYNQGSLFDKKWKLKYRLSIKSFNYNIKVERNKL